MPAPDGIDDLGPVIRAEAFQAGYLAGWRDALHQVADKFGVASLTQPFSIERRTNQLSEPTEQEGGDRATPEAAPLGSADPTYDLR